MRRAPSLGLAGALTAALLMSNGCSRGPKITAPVPAPAAAPVAVDTSASDDSSVGRSAGTNSASTPRPKKPAAKNPVATAQDIVPKVVSGSSTSAPTAPAVDSSAVKAPIVPQLSEKEQRELEQSSRKDIEEATTRLKSLDEAKLDADRQLKYRIAQGFLDDAIAARGGKDWMRASQLATKARVLAEELVAR